MSGFAGLTLLFVLKEPCSASSHGPAHCCVHSFLLWQGNPADPSRVICALHHLPPSSTLSGINVTEPKEKRLIHPVSCLVPQLLLEGDFAERSNLSHKAKTGETERSGSVQITQCQAGPGVQFLQADLFQLSCFPWGCELPEDPSLLCPT